MPFDLKTHRLKPDDARVVSAYIPWQAFLGIATLGELIGLSVSLLGRLAWDWEADAATIAFHLTWLVFSTLVAAVLVKIVIVQRQRRDALLRGLTAGRLYSFRGKYGEAFDALSLSKQDTRASDAIGEEDLLRLGNLRGPMLACHILNTSVMLALLAWIGASFWRHSGITGLSSVWVVAWLGVALGVLAWRWLALIWWGVKVSPAGVTVEPLWGRKVLVPWHEGVFCLVSKGLESVLAIGGASDRVVIRAPRGTMDRLVASARSRADPA